MRRAAAKDATATAKDTSTGPTLACVKANTKQTELYLTGSITFFLLIFVHLRTHSLHPGDAFVA